MASERDKHLSRREFVAGTGAAMIAAACTERAGAESAKRPNLIVLVTDDQRWDAMGCMGNPVIRTPNMDRLAAGGTVFDNHFCTTSICMASRATIFTGLYTSTHGITDFSMPLPEVRFAQSYPALLRQAGYRTGFVGKWGLGGPLPKDSFDHFEGFSGQGRYFQEIDGKTVHLTRLQGDHAQGFLRGCSADQPFCLSLSFKAPHVQDGDPRQYLYDPAFEDLYKDAVIPVPETAGEESFETLPDFLQASEGRTRWKVRYPDPAKAQESVRGYYRLLAGVDAVVGRILDTLDETGLRDNTIILFTSDNGLYQGAHGLAGKWFMHEESIRLPLVICDPRAPKSGKGERRDEMTLTTDLAPTLLDLARVERPGAMQGRSLTPLLAKPAVPGYSWRREWFYEHHYGHGGRIPQSEGIRTRNWKYIRYIDRDPLVEELYDLENDPIEKRNLAQSPDHRAQLESLRARWSLWRDRLDAFDPDSGVTWQEPRA